MKASRWFDYLALLVLLPCSASYSETEISFFLKMSMQINRASSFLYMYQAKIIDFFCCVDGGCFCPSFMYRCGGSHGGYDGAIFKQELGIG